MMSFESTARHQKLTQTIAHEIAKAPNQCISFARFMELALLAPSLGYYEASANIFGDRGDFITAPEITSLWSGCLARYCAPMLKATQSKKTTVIEIGGGTGRMAADLLLELERLECLPDCYQIVEVSRSLREKQQTNLKQWVPHLLDRIEHAAKLPLEPVEGVILANEVIDALPVHRFLLLKDAIYEHCVGRRHHQFVWQTRKPSREIQERVQAIQSNYLQGVESYCSEIRLSLDHWFAKLQASLKKGYIILIDYGRSQREYYHPERLTGTLRCYHQHFCNTQPLERVGLQDITSDVDFTHLAALATQFQWSVHAFVSQASFLIASGLLSQRELCYDTTAYTQLKGKIHQLIAPLQMGELCKVMVLNRGVSCDLLSLEAYDQRFSL